MCGGGPLPGKPTTSTTANSPSVSSPVSLKVTSSRSPIQTDLPWPRATYVTPFSALLSSLIAVTSFPCLFLLAMVSLAFGCRSSCGKTHLPHEPSNLPRSHSDVCPDKDLRLARR